MPRPGAGESARVKHRIVFCLVALLAASPVSCPRADGQVQSIKKAIDGSEPAKPAPAEKPEDVRKRLELWHQEARDTLGRLEAGGTTVALPEGITSSELDDRRRDLEQMVLITGGWLKNFNMASEARKAAETARSEDSAWTGFKEAPPYSVLMIDELLNERDAIKAKLSSNESSLANYERLVGSTHAEAKAAEEAISPLIVEVQNAAAGSAADAAKWRLEAARANSRLLATRAGYLMANCEAMRERIAAAKSELALIERKVRIAAPNSQLSDEDLAKVERISNERKAGYEKEINQISKRIKGAITTRTQAQAALDLLEEQAVEGKPPEGLELAKFRVEVAEVRIESLQSMTEGLESLVQLENIGFKAQQERAVLLKSDKPEEERKALESLGVLSDRLRAWLNVVDNDMTTCGAELSKLESRAASITSEDPRFALVNEQRAARSEMLAMLQRAYQTVEAQRKIIRRWIADHTPKEEEPGVMNRIQSIGPRIWQGVLKVWSFEVMSYEDSVEVDGQTITGKIPVTLGMLLRAICFFVIGYWIASRIANRIQRTMVARNPLVEPQIRMLRNWVMIIVGILLALGTLSFLGIPLAVFAFVGGALVIGVGFGTQTLIKNFISGIIVLAERKVRVGDVLDVDGIVGTVTEVNTRSSIIRSADDVETMIPNSLFLENRVTNWTLTSPKIRRNLRVGAAYGTDAPLVMSILTECAGRHGLICKEPAPFAVFEDFGDNALVFSLYFWVELGTGANSIVIASDLRLMIEKRFTEAGVGIPYPQRDMHLTTDAPIKVQISPPPSEP